MAAIAHILVIDKKNRGFSNSAFLLKLAGFRVSLFAEEYEACNWLLQQEATANPAQMLVLIDPQADNLLFRLLLQLRQKLPRLEYLFVAPQPMQLSGLITAIAPPIHQCRPEMLHTLTRRILGKSAFPSSSRRNHLPLSEAIRVVETQSGQE